MKPISLVNGKFEDKISVFDRGLAYGDGFFETMAWKKEDKTGNFFIEFWERHLKRLSNGCRKLNINLPSKSILKSHGDKIVRKAILMGYLSGIIKIIITRGSGGRGYKYEENMIPTVIFIVSEKPIYSVKELVKGVNVKFCNTKLSSNRSIAGYKHLNRLDSVLSRSEWNTKEIFEGLITDEEDNVIEGTMTNVFTLSNDVIYTPSIDQIGIKGIMREIVIEKFSNYFKDIIQCKISKEEFLNSESIFLTNSIIKIIPVKNIEGKMYEIDKRIENLINQLNSLDFLKSK
tara:strand:- start:31 stop:897 length:867 start_codon:yes stop_codon:yes gene_type:complete